MAFSAAAIHSTFEGLDSGPLYVGSIKTVIDHPGGAGITSLLKASHPIHRFVACGPEPLRDAVTPVMQWLAQHSEMHKIKPGIVDWRGHIDSLKMDEATEALCDSLVGDSPRARLLHYESLVRLREPDMEAFVELRKRRADLEEMKLLDWFDRTKDDGFGYFSSSHMASFEAGDQSGGDVLMMRR